MPHTTALSTPQNQLNSMEEHWLWYLSGAFDTAGYITVKIQKDSSYSVGYDFRPQIRLTRKAEYEPLFGMLDEYCDENHVYYRIEEVNQGDSIRFVIDDKDSIKRFLEPIFGGMVQQREAAELMLDEIIPEMENGSHQTKDGFFSLMGSVDRLRELSPGSREAKYTKDYFVKEWKAS